MTYTQVANTLENFITGKCGNWDWDDYLNTKFSDPYLVSVQVRMDGLPDEFPSPRNDHYTSPEGIDVIRNYINELRNKAAMGR
jgi:hypothetical protein